MCVYAYENSIWFKCSANKQTRLVFFFMAYVWMLCGVGRMVRAWRAWNWFRWFCVDADIYSKLDTMFRTQIWYPPIVVPPWEANYNAMTQMVGIEDDYSWCDSAKYVSFADKLHLYVNCWLFWKRCGFTFPMLYCWICFFFCAYRVVICRTSSPKMANI